MTFDADLRWTSLLVVGLLFAGTLCGRALKRAAPESAAVANLNDRMNSWWLMCLVFAAALVLGKNVAVALFGLLSFLALREFLTLTPTRLADHRTLFWSFFVFTPLQYYLVAIGWYGLFSILVPVYVFLCVPVLGALAGDTSRFLERTAKIQWGLMVCTYSLSHAPALLFLDVPGRPNENAKLLVFLVLVAELSDVFQYVWGKLAGSWLMAPLVSPAKTWEGFIGGVATATLAGFLLRRLTPFDAAEAAAMSLVIALAGVAGGLAMSAIKRDSGVKDYGVLLAGHGGVLDRLDSLCFAAPVFFHLTRYFFAI